MARSRRGRGGYSTFSEGGELNLTPLLDVIFNLIFFFILATTIRQEENFFDLTLPESREAPPTEIQEVIPEVSVAADGTLALNGELMTREQILARLKEIVENQSVTRAVLSADGEATVNQTTAATDIIYEAGIREMMQRVQKTR